MAEKTRAQLDAIIAANLPDNEVAAITPIKHREVEAFANDYFDQQANKGINAFSTGVLTGGVLSINADTTKFDLTAGKAFIVDNTTDPLAPTTILVEWNARTAQGVTNLATQLVTVILIDNAGVIVQQSSLPTPQQRRTHIFIGVVVHSNNTIINAINNLPVVGIDVGAQIQDLFNALGFFSVSGNLITPNGANLKIDKAAGVGFKAGINFNVDAKNPHLKVLPVQTPITFRYRDQLGVEGSDTQNLDPTTYDNAGTPTAVPSNNNATLQRVFLFPSNIVRVMKGQEVFLNLAEAVNASGKETFTLEPNIAENSLFLGTIAVKKTATDLSNLNDTKFIPAVSVGGAVGSETTLQQAYDVSTDPEIKTNSINGSFTVIEGQGDDTKNIYEGKNGAGDIKFNVTGEGNVYSSNLLKMAAVQSVAFAAVIGNMYPVDTSGGVVSVAPPIAPAPKAGDRFGITDSTRSFPTNNCNVLFSTLGSDRFCSASGVDVPLKIQDAAVVFEFISVAVGWVLFSGKA